MKTIAALILLSAAITAADAPAVSAPWARATAPRAQAAAAYATITAATDQALVSATTPRAGRVELHAITDRDGVAHMHAVERIALTANTAVVLKPGSFHIMLLDLPKGLAEGERFPLTLTFADGTTSTVEVPVGPIDAMGVCCLPQPAK